MLPRKEFFLIVGSLVIGITVLSSVYLSTSTTSLKSTAGEGKVTFYVWPREANLSLNQSFTLDIKILSLDKTPESADFILNYDPAFFTLEGEPKMGGAFSSYVGENIDPQSGTIALGGREQYFGDGTLLSLQMKAIKKGVANVRFSYAKSASLPVETQEATFTIK